MKQGNLGIQKTRFTCLFLDNTFVNFDKVYITLSHVDIIEVQINFPHLIRAWVSTI